MNKEILKFMNRLFITISLASSLLLSACNSNNAPIDDTTSSSSEIDNTAQVVVLLGQSNMEGHTWSNYLTKTMPDKAKEFADGYEDVKISFHNSGDYTSLNQFVPVKLGQGLNINRFGPEVGIAESVHNADKKNVFLVKYAIGATSLSGHWISPSSKKGGGSLYNSAVSYVLECMDKLEDMGYYPEIKAICWMQGEDDSNGSQYNNYYTYTKNFIKDLREDWKLYMDLDGIGFLDAGIAAIDTWKEHEIINNAKKQNALEDDLSDYIDTNAAGLKTNFEPVGAVDIYHYDSDSMIKLGRLFANVLLEKYLD